MNKTEQDYAAILTIRKGAGEVLWFIYEAITLQLAPGVRYTPDFAVMLADGTFEMHEVKGHWSDVAKVKIKTAAELFPIRFVAYRKIAKKDGGGWELTEF